MLDGILRGLWELLSQLGEWFLDLLLWLLEWVFEIVNMFLEWVIGIAIDLFEEFIGMVGPHLPAGLIGYMSDAFAYLGYAEPWFPAKFGIGLFVAFYAMKAVFLVVKWVLKLIPGIWG